MPQWRVTLPVARSRLSWTCRGSPCWPPVSTAASLRFWSRRRPRLSIVAVAAAGGGACPAGACAAGRAGVWPASGAGVGQAGLALPQPRLSDGDLDRVVTAGRAAGGVDPAGKDLGGPTRRRARRDGGRDVPDAGAGLAHRDARGRRGWATTDRERHPASRGGRAWCGRACMAAGQPHPPDPVGHRNRRHQPGPAGPAARHRAGSFRRAAYADWLRRRDPAWREHIRTAALDPFRGYLTALRAHLPKATHMLDAFHVTRLGMQALDEVRRRVQQQTRHRRGHAGDPSTKPAGCCAGAPTGSPRPP